VCGYLGGSSVLSENGKIKLGWIVYGWASKRATFITENVLMLLLLLIFLIWR
jgi:hypothetical protein